MIIARLRLIGNVDFLKTFFLLNFDSLTKFTLKKARIKNLLRNYTLAL